MAQALMITCDNPECDAIDHPEWVPGQDGTRKRKGQKIIGPYGWHQGEGFLIGCGPNYAYNACSIECVGPAVAHVLQLAAEADAFPR